MSDEGFDRPASPFRSLFAEKNATEETEKSCIRMSVFISVSSVLVSSPANGTELRERGSSVSAFEPSGFRICETSRTAKSVSRMRTAADDQWSDFNTTDQPVFDREDWAVQ